MANIQSNLNKIKNAVLGVDVRDSIHDGIKAINEEVENTTDRQVQLEGTFDELVINAGNSNAEVAAARVDSTGKSHGTLGKRLNNFDSQIKEKVNKTDLIESNQLAESTLELIKGNFSTTVRSTLTNTLIAGSDIGSGFTSDSTGKFYSHKIALEKGKRYTIRCNKENIRYLVSGYDDNNTNVGLSQWKTIKDKEEFYIHETFNKFRITFGRVDNIAFEDDTEISIVDGLQLIQSEINDNSITYKQLNENTINEINLNIINKIQNLESVDRIYSYPNNGIQIGMDVKGEIEPPAIENLSVVTINKLNVANKITINTSFECKIIVYSYKENEGLGFSSWKNYTLGDEIKYSNDATHIRITIAKQDGTSITQDDTISVVESAILSISYSLLDNDLKNMINMLSTNNVIVGENCKYKSVVDAVNSVEENTTINILPGEYYGTIQAFNKEIILKGVDRNKCKIISTNGAYAYPPMNGSCGYFENLTFYHKKTEDSIDTTNVAGGYAVHIESDYSANKKMTFVNCDFISDFYPALGAGLRPNFTLEFINCNFYTSTETMYSSLDADSYLGAVYFHDSDTSLRGDNQNIIFKNCQIVSKGKYTIVPYSMNSNNNMNCLFVNTLAFSETNKKNNIVYHRVIPSEGMWSGVCCKLDEKSYGNNITELNS